MDVGCGVCGTCTKIVGKTLHSQTTTSKIDFLIVETWRVSSGFFWSNSWIFFGEPVISVSPKSVSQSLDGRMLWPKHGVICAPDHDALLTPDISSHPLLVHNLLFGVTSSPGYSEI